MFLFFLLLKIYSKIIILIKTEDEEIKEIGYSLT